jgi:hypothetical protein
VTDDLLARLDAQIGAASTAASKRTILRLRSAEQLSAGEASKPTTLRDRWPWVALFLTIQFLWGALLFLPGSQEYRPIVRALPYAISAGLLVVYMPAVMRSRAPRGTLMLLGALGLLVFNLLHPTSQLQAGVAQCVFQAAIAAPMFWAWRSVASARRMRQLLWIAFILNTLGAVLGVLQVYYPERFMPPQFSTLGLRLNDMYVVSLSYVGANGELIVRPPGLSDQPGGAAVAGAVAVVLGAGLSLTAQTPATLALTLGSTAVGLAAIYLTQVRSLLLMSVGALGVVALVLFRKGQARVAGRIAITAAVLVVGSFIWARSLGGESVEQRFVGITREGAMRTYQENRGGFVSQTFGELLDQYPLGAGVGRWGMMNIYFADPANLESSPIHVEIQPTGWLLDGGVPMWIFYGGAVLMALLSAYRYCVQRLSKELGDVALVVLGAEILIVGFGWAGPVFNTQLGLLFWFLASALYGAARGEQSQLTPDAVSERDDAVSDGDAAP